MNNQTDTTIYALQNKAKVGDAQAQFELAVCYIKGKGIEENVELASQWLKKSAEQGQAEAQFILGFLYLKDNKCNFSLSTGKPKEITLQYIT